MYIASRSLHARLFHSNDYSIIVQCMVEIFLEKKSDVEKNFRDVKDENREEICTYELMSMLQSSVLAAFPLYPLSAAKTVRRRRLFRSLFIQLAS